MLLCRLRRQLMPFQKVLRHRRMTQYGKQPMLHIHCQIEFFLIIPTLLSCADWEGLGFWLALGELLLLLVIYHRSLKPVNKLIQIYSFAVIFLFWHIMV